MKKKIVIGFMSVLVVVGLIAGCGSSGDKASSYDMTEEAAPAGEAYATDDIYMNGATAVEEEAYDSRSMEEPAAAEGGETQSVAANRKLIKNVNMEVETEDFDTLVMKVEQKTQQLGGYAESTNISGRSYGVYDDSSQTRYASMTIRVPSAKLDEFVSEVSEISNVINKNESAEDITLQYVDTKSRRDSYQVEYDRLQELLDEAKDLDTIIALESRMTEVRYQLENYESQLRTYDNLVDFSTIYLNISEVKRLTPQVEESRWDKIRVGFVESIYNVTDGLLDFGVGFIIVLPYLLIWAIIIVVIILIIRAIIKALNKRDEKIEAKKRAAYAQQQALTQKQAQTQQQTQAQAEQKEQNK